MIKHQRRAHQQEVHSGDMAESYDMDSDYLESPHTPYQPAGVTWPLHVDQTGPHPDSTPLPELSHGSESDYSASGYRRHSTVSQVSSMVGMDMTTTEPSSSQVSPIMSKHPIYVPAASTTAAPEADEPCMTAAPATGAMTSSAVPRTYFVPPRHHVDIPYPVHEIDIPEEPSPPSHNSSFVSTDSSFYDSAPPAPSDHSAAASAAPTPIAHQHYQQQAPPPQQPVVEQYHDMAYTPRAPAPAPYQTHPAAPGAPAGMPLWTDYQTPIEMTTIGQMPAFGSGMFNLYMEPKLDFDDPSMQLPSARLQGL